MAIKLQIMSPAAARVDFKVAPATRLDTLNGKTIGLYNNMTGGAEVAVNRVAEHLSQRFPGCEVRELRREFARPPACPEPGSAHRRG